MDYKNAKIYKIIDIGYTKMYIGSTTQPLYKRLSKHKCDYKRWKNGKLTKKITSFDLFDEFGIENCKIELVEEFKCENKEQLHKKEGEHIKNNICVNKFIAGRTRKEYNEVNKDKIKERKNQYYEANKERQKAYHKANKEQQKSYREVNKEKIKEYKKKYDESNKERYKQYYEVNKDIIKEQRKKYYELNKDKIKEYKKKYYESKKNNCKSLEISTD